MVILSVKARVLARSLAVRISALDSHLAAAGLQQAVCSALRWLAPCPSHIAISDGGGICGDEDAKTKENLV